MVSTAIKTGKHQEYLSHDPNYAMAAYYQSKKNVEDAVRASDIRFKTFLRPGWLMHNYLSPHSGFHFPSTYQSEHIIEVPYPPGTTAAHFDAADVGKFAAAAFLSPSEYDGHAIELGNEQLTVEEAAMAIGKAAGVQMKTRYLIGDEDEDLERVKSIYTYGMWQWVLKEGNFITDPRDLAKYPIRLTTFEAFVEREKQGLKETLGIGKE